MPSMLTRALRLTVLGGLTATGAAVAQPAPRELAAVNAVMDFRLNWVGDATPFNACSIYTIAGRPSDFPAGLLPGLVRGLDRADHPCDGRTPGVPGARVPEVLVDSVRVLGETARVFTTIHRGEVSYCEDYSLVHAGAGRWAVAEVRTYGALREYPVRP
jgi:hypothetical protein